MASEIARVLLDLVVLLALAKVLGEVAERLRQPAVLGELLAGFLLGPTILGLVDLAAGGPAVEIVRFVAELGAILLLFEVGLETKLREMVRVGASATLVAIVGIVGSFAAGFAASWALTALHVWEGGWLFHTFIGATLTATSVGLTARVLADLGRLSTAEARIVLGAAVLDDVGGLLILAVVSALAGGALDGWGLARTMALAVAFLGLVLALGVPFAPRLMDLVDRARVRGAVLAAAVAFALLLAYAAEGVGLAAIVGAFAAGLVLAGARQQPQLAERVKPLADVFVPLFFAYVGLQVDLRGLGGDAGRIAIAVGVLALVGIAGKLVSGFAVLERSLDRLAVGVGMVPRGEVGLIFALVGLSAGLLLPWEYAAVLLVVALTTLVTPPWLKLALSRRPAA